MTRSGGNCYHACLNNTELDALLVRMKPTIHAMRQTEFECAFSNSRGSITFHTTQIVEDFFNNV